MKVSDKDNETSTDNGIMIRTVRTCRECHRKFDLLDEDDAAEWHYGHDCEFE